jgi:hypothetical protein
MSNSPESLIAAASALNFFKVTAIPTKHTKSTMAQSVITHRVTRIKDVAVACLVCVVLAVEPHVKLRIAKK